MTPFTIWLGVVLFILGLAWWWGMLRLAARLRDRFPQVYDKFKLYRIHRDETNVSRSLWRFLWYQHYLKLKDPEVSRLAGMLRLVIPIFWVLFAGELVATYRANREEDRVEALADAHERAQYKQQVEQYKVDLAEYTARKPRDDAFDLYRQSQYERAIEAFSALLGPRADDAELLYFRGAAHARLNRLEPALADFRRVIQLEPESLRGHVAADRVLSRQRRWDEILEIWNPYIARSPNDAEALHERSGTYFRKGDRAAARADAARACELGRAQACRDAEGVKP